MTFLLLVLVAAGLVGLVAFAATFAGFAEPVWSRKASDTFPFICFVLFLGSLWIAHLLGGLKVGF